jgi:hypothetical protein
MMRRLPSPVAARIAGNVATAGFLLAAVLQLLLAAGLLPVSMAWGGSLSVLTPQLQIASLAAALLLGLFAFVIRRRAGLAGHTPPSKCMWLLTYGVGEEIGWRANCLYSRSLTYVKNSCVTSCALSA